MRNLTVIVGLGMTGFSCANFLAREGVPFAMMDTRLSPPKLKEFQMAFPDIPLVLGKMDETLLNQAHQIILSPGLSLQQNEIAAQISKGVPILGDIELFARAAKKPLIAITGTNAKSTVTTLVGEMMKASGFKTEVGGNLGKPALDLLQTPDVDVYVLEISSFQLETTHSLQAKVATVLNVTPDHMDRYHDLSHYAQVKQSIYRQCEIAVCNRDDPLTNYEASRHTYYFTLDKPQANQWGLLPKGQDFYLAFEDQPLLSVKALPILGKHYQANALAALAIGHSFGLNWEVLVQVLTQFRGLPHRCQLIHKYLDVVWYNDSKGTNVGAAAAAIEGLGKEISGKIILIAGGVGKNADFSPLIPIVKRYVRKVVLMGEAAPLLAEVLKDAVLTEAGSMEEAVIEAAKAAQAGDCVLLSPACASFDMFRNFEHRGEVFTKTVKELVK